MVQSKFWTDAKGLVVVTRKDGSSFRTSPLNLGVESELYTRFPDDETKDLSIEAWFAETIDGPARVMIDFFENPPNIRRVPFSGDPSKAAILRQLGFRVDGYVTLVKLPFEVRKAASRYLAALLVRHPGYLSKLARFHSEANPSHDSRALALENMLHMYEIYADRIERAVLSIVRRGGTSEFVYGDGGLSVQEPWRDRYGIPFDIHAPLTPDLAVEVLPTPFDDDLSILPIDDLTNQGVARYNRISVGTATRFVFSRQSPPIEFIKSNFGVPAPKNIGFRIVDGELETKYDPTRK